MAAVSLGRLLDLREGEGRVGFVLFTHLFFITAAAIVVSAAKNGLFLSAYPAELIPHVIIAAAVTTAVFAILFTGLAGLLSRRMLVEATVAVAAVSLVVGRAAFLADPRWAFALYLWLSVVGALVMALSWGSVGDLLTGRQSRRLMPILIAGTSMAGMAAGFGLAPAAEAFGTPNLLLGAAIALLLGAGVLRLAPAAPGAGGPAERDREPGNFLSRARRGATLIRNHRLLGLLAAGVVVSAVLATLVDYQFKAVLQQSYDRDAITSVFGMLAGAVGFGTLLFQGLASRFLFRRWGLASGIYVQSALVGIAALAVAVTGWIVALAALRFVDETGRFTLQKSVEQVSVAPFPTATRRAALTVLGGVLKPLATAATGLILMALAPILGVPGLAVLTALAALGLLLLFRRHPALYRDALGDALARHTLNLDDVEGVPSVLDRSALEALDRALESDDPALLLFSISLLRRAPRSEALGRLGPLLDHDVAEVRAEAAVCVVDMADGEETELLDRVREMVRTDPSTEVLRSLLDVVDRMGGSAIELVSVHLDHPEESVRRRALVGLARSERVFGGDRATRMVERLLVADRVEDRLAGLDAVAVLRFTRLAGPAFRAAHDPRTRTAAAAALAALGEEGEEWLDRLLSDPEVEDSDLGPIAVQLADAGHVKGLRRLLGMAAERGVVRDVVLPLRHGRRSGHMKAIPAPAMRVIVTSVLAEGARYGLIADGFRRNRSGRYAAALRDELAGRQERAGEAVLAALSLSYDPAGIDQVAPHLRSNDPALRSNALELLEEFLETEDRIPVISFFEGFESADRLEDAATAVGLDHPGRDPLAALATVPDPWLRECAEYVRSRGRVPAGIRSDPLKLHDPNLETDMIPRMEIVFFLKSSRLFQSLPGDELARLASLADTIQIDADEVLFRQGDPGDAFYMVVSGKVAVVVGTREVAAYGPHEGIGEMALLDGEPRSATVRGIEPSTLLRIDQAAFEALVDRTPALAKAIYRALSARLRTANLQLQD